MGILEDIFGRKEEPARLGLPFNIKTSLRPVRLLAKKENCLELLVNVRNVSQKPVMVSVALELPKPLGFENLGITRIKEVRIGEIEPQKEKNVSFAVCSNMRTSAGIYSAILCVNEHYRDYQHIVNYAKKSIGIRVV